MTCQETLESRIEYFRDRLHSVPLGQMPQWSPWPARLLGIEPWQKKPRTVERVNDEYENDKYAKCLKHLDQHPQATIEEIKQFEFGRPGDSPVLVSIKDELYRTTQHIARQLHYAAMIDNVIRITRGSRINTIVELGAGYGYNLQMLCEAIPGIRKFIGMELSANAVEIGNRCFAANLAVELQEFDFCQGDHYRFLTELQGPVLVFTCHAIEQLQSFAVVAQNLAQARDQIQSVLHVEPQHDRHACGLLGLMRHRYSELNDYNVDMMQVLSEDPAIEIISREMDVYGLNPLNPTSVIHWRFR